MAFENWNKLVRKYEKQTASKEFKNKNNGQKQSTLKQSRGKRWA